MKDFSRDSLLTMRRVLLDKCEEVINRSANWPHGAQVGGLKTDKIFFDLLQYYEQSSLHQKSQGSVITVGMNYPTMAGSNKTLMHTNISGSI
jgi:hypothetical protein